MKAAVSGRAAAAIVVHGDAWFRIDGDEPSVVKPAGPHEWPFVFGLSEDIQYVEAESFDEIRSILRAAVDENHALTLALICLDMGSEFQTKIESAQYLEDILSRTETASAFLWRVFTAKPLPRDSSVDDACDASVSAAEVRTLFERLRRYQPTIAQVNDAWQSLPEQGFGSVHRGELRSFAIHSGIWQSYVEAAFDGRAQRVPDIRELPVEWPTLRVRGILGAWADRVAETSPARWPIRILAREPVTAAAPPPEDRTLFAATDVDMEALQSIDFHGSLINNLLLRRQLVIPDLYFFTSRGIAGHLCAPDSLLEHAIAEGLVVAATRYRGADFDTTYQVMRRQRLVIRPCQYVQRLQQAAERNQRDTFLYWPIDGVSTAYERYLAVLEADAPPPTALQTGGSALEKNWELTRDWRRSLINQAREATRRHGGTGVHKRELFRQLVKAVVGRAALEITGIGSLLRVAGDLADKVRTFWSWAAEGHRFSRAQMLNALIYSPGYEKVQNLFVTSAIGSLTESDLLHVYVELPSTSTLKELPARCIIDLRKGPGADYFEAVDRCRRNPEERAQLKSAIERYAAEVLKVCDQRVPRIKVKRVELSVGLSSSSSDGALARQQDFLAITTFDSFPGKLYDRYLRGGKIGVMTVNKQTDVCVTNGVPGDDPPLLVNR
jgi:hypothetical protein